MTAGEVHHLRHLGLGDLVAEHAHDGKAFFVNGEHDFDRLSMVHAEKTFQHMHDELHRSVVVVEDQNLVERWTLGFWARLHGDRGVGSIVGALIRWAGVEEERHRCHARATGTQGYVFHSGVYITLYAKVKRGRGKWPD